VLPIAAGQRISNAVPGIADPGVGSRMNRTDLCGGRGVTCVPTAILDWCDQSVSSADQNLYRQDKRFNRKIIA
jgi:hypothetical protein